MSAAASRIAPLTLGAAWVGTTGLGAVALVRVLRPETVPPLMRRDHVLVAGDVSVASLEARASVGSDHLRLVADLGVGTDRGRAG